MAHIAVPPDVPGIRSLLAFRPEIATAIGELADLLLHAPKHTVGRERELIAAYVWALNDCAFCRDSHAAIARATSLMRRARDAVVADAEQAPVSPKLRALLAIAARVQRGGRDVRDSDVARARSEGATDSRYTTPCSSPRPSACSTATWTAWGRFTPTDPVGYRERARFVADHGYAAAIERNAVG